MAAFENLSCLKYHHEYPILALVETTTKLVRQINSFCRIRQWRPLKICHVYNVNPIPARVETTTKCARKINSLCRIR